MIRKVPGWLAATALLAACAPQSRAGLSPRSAQPATGLNSADDNVLSESVRTLSAQIVDEGYQLRGPVERGFLAPSARSLKPLTVPARSCIAILAVATPSITDLDAALYAPDGTVLAEDDAADARPLLRMCTRDEPVTGYLALYAYQGTGTYALAQLTRAASEADAPSESPAEPTGSAGFVELVRALRSRGYRDEGPGTDLPLVQGTPLRLASRVLAGQCYSVVADGEQLFVRLLDEEGHEVALGVAGEQPAALQYCAPRSGEFTIEVGARGASRSAHLLRLRAAQNAVGGARAVWLGEPATAVSQSTPSSAAKQSCSERTQPIAQHVPLAQGQLRELPLRTFSTSTCAEWQVELHEGLKRITLRVEQENGTQLATAEIQERGSIAACGVGRAARLVAVGRSGFGALSVEQRACHH